MTRLALPVGPVARRARAGPRPVLGPMPRLEGLGDLEALVSLVTGGCGGVGQGAGLGVVQVADVENALGFVGVEGHEDVSESRPASQWHR